MLPSRIYSWTAGPYVWVPFHIFNCCVLVAGSWSCGDIPITWKRVACLHCRVPLRKWIVGSSQLTTIRSAIVQSNDGTEWRDLWPVPEVTAVAVSHVIKIQELGCPPTLMISGVLKLFHSPNSLPSFLLLEGHGFLAYISTKQLYLYSDFKKRYYSAFHPDQSYIC